MMIRKPPVCENTRGAKAYWLMQAAKLRGEELTYKEALRMVISAQEQERLEQNGTDS